MRQQQAKEGCSSETTATPPPPASTGSQTGSSSLSTEREVSSIPRQDDSAKSSPGNWVYPSEQQFFDAMRRKKWDPREPDMRAIVPIHNAVNERAWQEILQWEKGRGGESCGGPKLVSFKGDASKLTPKARLMVLMGYQPPFDRHDWTIDRCGKRVDYVIDFYSGKKTNDAELSFYLDVRPKLSPEGIWMRAQRSLTDLFK